MAYLLPIGSLDSENMSGIRPILVARKADIATFPEQFEGIALEEIGFKPGRDWTEWMATYLTAGFSTRSADSMEGVSAAKELPFVIPRHHEQLTRMLRKAEQDEFILLVEDLNGQRYLFGSLEQPVRFAFDMQTGNGRDRNQYACRFYSESPFNLISYPRNLGTGDTDFSACPPVIIRRGSSEGPILAIVPAGATVVINSPYSFGYQIIAS